MSSILKDEDEDDTVEIPLGSQVKETNMYSPVGEVPSVDAPVTVEDVNTSIIVTADADEDEQDPATIAPLAGGGSAESSSFPEVGAGGLYCYRGLCFGIHMWTDECFSAVFCFCIPVFSARREEEGFYKGIRTEYSFRDETKNLEVRHPMYQCDCARIF
mmetsp:Transcript_21224/g.35582  ORF Transcript_21224/g.35582 Transcript_21224/m.35582 type:complete len:159 (-) Transcript_21224:6-482(-)